MLGYILWAVFLVFVGLGGAARAGDGGEGAIALPCALQDLVVTASRHPVALGDEPQALYGLDRADVQLRPAGSVEDLLRGIPGVVVEGYRGLDTPPRRIVSLGGAGSEQSRTLVLLDGAPLNSMNSGWVEWDRVALEEVDRIEALRGPGSGLYGSSALGGVIQVLTRPPEAMQGTRLLAAAGSHQSRRWRLDHGGGGGTLHYHLGAGGRVTDGYVAEEHPEDYNIARYQKEQRYRTRVQWTPDKSGAFLFGVGHYGAERGHGRRFFRADVEADDVDLRGWRETAGARWSWSAFAGREETASDYDSTADSFATLDRREVLPTGQGGGAVQAVFDMGERQTWTVGTDARFGRTELDTDYVRDPLRGAGSGGRQGHLALFAQDQVRLAGGRLVATLGARGDHIRAYDGHAFDEGPGGAGAALDEHYDSATWKALSPKAGLVYRCSAGTSLRFSAGRGFRAPTLYELYTTVLRGYSLYRGNPELNPERVNSYEAGIDHEVTPGWLARLTTYQGDADDFISRIQTAATEQGGEYEYMNVSSVTMDGVELQVFGRLGQRWRVLGGYTLSRSRIDSFAERPELEGNDLPYTPRQTGSAGVRYGNEGGLELALQANAVGDRFADDRNTAASELFGYVTVDVGLVQPVGHGVRLTLDVENLFDVEYEPYRGPTVTLLAPGRWIEAGLAVDL